MINNDTKSRGEAGRFLHLAARQSIHGLGSDQLVPRLTQSLNCFSLSLSFSATNDTIRLQDYYYQRKSTGDKSTLPRSR